MSELPFEPVTHLWFTGVNNITGKLVLYDALTDTERTILDGICLDIETPENSHELRYYIRRSGNGSDNPDNPVATGINSTDITDTKTAKIIKNGHVYIVREGHVYTMFGQKVR
jgi:hypothetical protein